MDTVLYLGPVTRITLEELASTDQDDTVNVYLKTGTTRSQVRHADNKRVNYQVHTAVAVASCRGTDWIIDDSNNIICFEGTVAVAAYVPPENYLDNKSGSGKKEDAEGESEGSEESTEETPAVADAGAESESSAETTETTTLVTETPTTNDGILVKANQSVTVSITSEVSVPINTVVTTVSNVTSAVKTASEKEAVATVETNETPSVIASEDSKSQVTTGTVVVNIEFDE